MGEHGDSPVAFVSGRPVEQGTLAVAEGAPARVSGRPVAGAPALPTTHERFVLAFDTSNEVIAIAVGRLECESHTITPIVHEEFAAHRASNTQLIPHISQLLESAGIARSAIACVAVGVGPGSFTGVRIALATAKGIASALEVGLVAISTLDALAWGIWKAGVRGDVCIVADAMRKEVYPVRYRISENEPARLEPDHVVKAQVTAEQLAGLGVHTTLFLAGDALEKYDQLFEPCGTLLPRELWTLAGDALLYALEDLWQQNKADPFDALRHNPAFALPVYTRLSDAEEAERLRLTCGDGFHAPARKSVHVTMNDTALSNARGDMSGIVYKPLDRAHVDDIAALEMYLMGTDAWDREQLFDELGRSDRSWWVAFAGTPHTPLSATAPLVGYAGGWVIDGDLQILKVGVHPDWQRRSIAQELVARVAFDGRNLGAQRSSLEVRASNTGAQKFYAALGFSQVGVRPHYYSDGEDACIMAGGLPVFSRDVAGMNFVRGETTDVQKLHDSASRPLILAIESSCDETAAAIVDGGGAFLSDVLASQVDFHARFGGVVPEIASRKHIEAICGVCDECLDEAAGCLGSSMSHFEQPCEVASTAHLRWRDLDAVAATYTPGLVGALVVGVAFAKGAAWAINKPFIGVNHLEGHLYANRIGCPDFEPPALVSLVSGGNTLLVYMKDWGSYETLGSTIDDAVGEAFDKVAKALGLGYPGGPAISHFAAEGNPAAIAFPRAMLHSGDLRFSLSGLKTAVVNYINDQRSKNYALNVADICASFEQAVIDVQVAKVEMALEQTGAPTFALGGGVAANPSLRAAYEDLCARKGIRLVMPPLSACGDNAGMIALVALDRYRQQKFFDFSADAYAHSNLDEPY